MNRIFVISLLLVMLCVPLVTAASYSQLLSDYKHTQTKYQEIRDELDECRLLDDDCDNIEEDLLNPAVNYAEAGVELMLAYIDHIDSDNLVEAETELRTASDNLKYVDSKEEFDKILDSIIAAWGSAANIIKLTTVTAIYDEVKELVTTGKIIDAKLSCAISALDSSTSALDDSHNSFNSRILEAEKHIKNAEEILESDPNSAFATIKLAQSSLKNSQALLSSALELLETQGGSLCTEVVIDETIGNNDANDGLENEMSDLEDETNDDTEQIKLNSVDKMLDDCGLSNYYDDAKEAIENLVSNIEKKQADDYDTSKADDILKTAENYIEDTDDTLKKGSCPGVSKLLNAKNEADRGMGSGYYTKVTGTSSSGSSEDYVKFVACMEKASYSYQRRNCYEDYDISSGTQEDIEDCLNKGTSEETCYADASDEAKVQENDEANDLFSQLTELEDSLDNLENDVQVLFNYLADTGINKEGNDYKTIYAAIEDLLDEVQNQNGKYKDDINDIEKLINDKKYDDAQDAIDGLDDEINNSGKYIADISTTIDNIKDDIDAL